MRKKEYKIRLDQTKKVFEAINSLFRDEGCTYRYLIYDMLGFEPDAYVELIDGLAITNYICDYEELKDDYEKLKRDYEILEYTLDKVVKQPYVYSFHFSGESDKDLVEAMKKGPTCNE